MIEAAGILFVAPDNKALFLSRSSHGDAAGMWAFPGGKVEDTDKDLKAAAVRECREETGYRVKPDDLVLHTRRQREGVDFTTFLVRVENEFTPKLDNEHDGYAWAPIDKPPAPLHPGCAVALYRLSADELGVARLMVSGELTSPQKYENVWLFDIRVTGTGVAYRNKLDEFAHRPPEEYLNPEFLARCNGLPVIWQHPEEATLNSEEFAKRIVGTLFLPYIGDGVRHPADDVWAIAKIHTEKAAKKMQETQLSTSPGVVLKKEDVKEKMELSNGSTLLLEGKPHLLDHLAICEVGVWDKGNAPTGVALTEGDTAMEAARKDAETETEAKKADAEPVTVDKLLKCVDSLNKRMDAYEEEEKAADARRRDGQTMGTDFANGKGSTLDDNEDDREDRRRGDDDDDDDRRRDARRGDDDDDRRSDRRRGDARRKDGDLHIEHEGEDDRRGDRRRGDARRKDEDEDEMRSDRRRGDARRRDEDEGYEDDDRRRGDRRRGDDDDDRRSDARRYDRRRYDARRHDDDERDTRADSVQIPRAQWDAMQRDMEALKSRMPKPLTDADFHALAEAQERADAVYGAFGANIRAPRPMDGETLPGYRRRLAAGLQKHSPRWKEIDLYAINDAALVNVEQDVYNDAMAVARNPADLGEGELRSHRRILESGHTSVDFYGKPSAWMNEYAGNRRLLAGVRTKSN
jgi:8-oxo-dGTP pyrophosphatase MutT (NUDIX family)